MIDLDPVRIVDDEEQVLAAKGRAITSSVVGAKRSDRRGTELGIIIAVYTRRELIG